MISHHLSDLKLGEVTYAEPVVRRSVKSGRYRFLITGFGFIGLLLLPVLDQLLGLSAGFKSTEKRILAPLPVFAFPHVRAYMSQFNHYFSENFGWRNALFYQYSQWKYKVVGASPLPEKVVVGKNGWFYPGNSLGRVADQHRGLLPLSSDTLHLIASRLARYQRQLAGQGTQLYVLIAPDSYTIYPEHLPDQLRSAGAPSNFDLLKTYLSQQTRVPLVDVRRALREAKARHVVYRRTDTHWNDYGSLVATLSLVRRIRQDFPQVPNVRLLNYGVRPLPGEGGDLVTMLALNQELTDSVSYRIRPVTQLMAWQTECIAGAAMGLPSQRFVSRAKRAPKLVLVGDSFSYNMNDFLPGYFRESYIVRSNQLNMDLIRTERPKVVVVEIVERNIALLAQL